MKKNLTFQRWLNHRFPAAGTAIVLFLTLSIIMFGAIKAWFQPGFAHTFWGAASWIALGIEHMGVAILVLGYICFRKFSVDTGITPPSVSKSSLLELGWGMETPFRVWMNAGSAIACGILYLMGRFDVGIYMGTLSLLLMLTWCWNRDRGWVYPKILVSGIFIGSLALHQYWLMNASYLLSNCMSLFARPSLRQKLLVKPTVATVLSEVRAFQKSLIQKGDAPEKSWLNVQNTNGLSNLFLYESWEEASTELNWVHSLEGMTHQEHVRCRAQIDSETGKLEQVAEACEAATAEERERLIPFLGIAYAKAGNHEKAIAIAEEMSLPNSNRKIKTDRVNAIGRIYSEIGDYQNAIKWTEIAFRRSRGANKSCLYLARLYANAGEMKEARCLMERYVREAPCFPKEELEELSDLCCEMNDPRGADKFERLSRLVA